MRKCTNKSVIQFTNYLFMIVNTYNFMQFIIFDKYMYK